MDLIIGIFSAGRTVYFHVVRRWEPTHFTTRNMSSTARGDMHSSFSVFQHTWQCIGVQFFLYLTSLKWLTFNTSILNPLSDVGPSGICKAWTKASVNCCTTGKIRTLAAPWVESMQAQVKTRNRTPTSHKSSMRSNGNCTFLLQIQRGTHGNCRTLRSHMKYLFQTWLWLPPRAGNSAQLDPTLLNRTAPTAAEHTHLSWSLQTKQGSRQPSAESLGSSASSFPSMGWIMPCTPPSGYRTNLGWQFRPTLPPAKQTSSLWAEDHQLAWKLP